MLKENGISKAEEQSKLNKAFEENKRAINEKYSALKGKLIRVQADSSANLDSKDKWRNYALELQDTFDQLFRLA